MARYSVKSTYDSRPFDSNLELNAYKLLQLMKVKFTFHEYTITLLKGYKADAFSDRTKKIYVSKIQPITYTPEFVIPGPNNLILYIEMKGFSENAFRLKWKMFKAQLQLNEKAFVIKCNNDLVYILEKYNIQRGIDPQKLQQQFDL